MLDLVGLVTEVVFGLLEGQEVVCPPTLGVRAWFPEGYEVNDGLLDRESE